MYYGNLIKYVIMSLSDISFTKSWQLYSLIIIAIKADNYIHSLIYCNNSTIYHFTHLLCHFNHKDIYDTMSNKYLILFHTFIHSLWHYLIYHALKTDNYIHSLMMETYFSYTKYLTKCDNIILFHILVPSYNYCSQYVSKSILLSE